MYVDRSGMGQGVIAYTTGVQPLSRNGERQVFAINEQNELVFKDPASGIETGFQACPGAVGGGYNVWLGGANTNPAGQTNCIPFSALAVKDDSPVKCTYTQ
ncbi:cell wall [Pyrenophora seminiperda CCB06]|uniref:Cell wall n=1 Tax=Pyrenophora seminiperda CCB06 TaxID=1302712 RepID=A0A3M7MBT3_9PLEO|nr:cell wall [Pyrenophora seminiperda CCB06]